MRGTRRAVVGARDIGDASRRAYDLGIEIDFANIGIVGIGHVEVAPHQDKSVGAFESRTRPGAVVAAFFESFSGDQRNAVTGGVNRGDGVVARTRDPHRAAVGGQAPGKVEPRPGLAATFLRLREHSCAHDQYASDQTRKHKRLDASGQSSHDDIPWVLRGSAGCGRYSYGNIAFTTSSIARLLSLSSVNDQVTATVAARRGVMPWRISSPA